MSLKDEERNYLELKIELACSSSKNILYPRDDVYKGLWTILFVQLLNTEVKALIFFNMGSFPY